LLAFIEDFLKENYLKHSRAISIQPISKGVENKNYLVETGEQAYVLRVYSRQHATTGLREKADIAFELDFMEHVRKQGVPTPAVIENFAGAKITEMWEDGKMHYSVLFSCMPGREAPAYNAENARSMARTLIDMHKASQAYPNHSVRRWPGDMVGSSLAYYRENRGLTGLHADKLDSLYTQAAGAYRKIKSQSLPTGIIHGDIKLENVLFEGDCVSAVLDFDDYRESYLLEEFTRTVMHDLDSLERNAIRSGHFAQFREVFARSESISQAEIVWLEPFLKARFLYDITVYMKNGLFGLVEDLFADPHVAELILA
jgi:Ser/Thr protein kinase RdoA (MazF antagonist)